MTDPRPLRAWQIDTPSDLAWAENTYDKERKLHLKARSTGDISAEREHRINARRMLNKILSFHFKNRKNNVR
jgi:hypothetical protein